MIKFDVITIFPSLFDCFLRESLIARAQKKKLIKIKIHNLRKWSNDKHKKVDDRPYGGGLGMVLKVEPIYKAVSSIKNKNKGEKNKVIIFTPRGKIFNQKMAYNFSKLDRIIMICGRYEGVDERVAKHIADLEVSIGRYDLMGGEVPSMVVMEAVSRLIPGVLGKEILLKERISKSKGFFEYPQYTRPEVFVTKEGETWKVPKVLLSGNHKKIDEWRKKHGMIIEK
jgi:tRNA (guanine37-N1)-methyltransferase